MNIHKQDLPQNISDTRLDTIIDLYALAREGKSLQLSFAKTKHISPAGMALLCNLLDTASEFQVHVELTNLNTENSEQTILNELSKKVNESKNFINEKEFRLETKTSLNWFKVSSIAPELIEKINRKFSSHVTEEKLWNVTLILNELMQNAVDHSTSERYFIYAGISDDDFEFGVVDRGVTIPAKLEVKYNEEDDESYIKKSLEYTVGTRRNRKGGMGLYYLFEILKEDKGKMVIISRNGQLRRYFSSRNITSGKLKTTLYGTWCMARIPLGDKK